MKMIFSFLFALICGPIFCQNNPCFRKGMDMLIMPLDTSEFRYDMFKQVGCGHMVNGYKIVPDSMHKVMPGNWRFITYYMLIRGEGVHRIMNDSLMRDYRKIQLADTLCPPPPNGGTWHDMYCLFVSPDWDWAVYIFIPEYPLGDIKFKIIKLYGRLNPKKE